MSRTRIDVLGTGAGLLEPGKECSSYVVNRELLIDLGWCAALRMPAQGIEPSRIRTLVITHSHEDHVLGLPQFLYFYTIGPRKKEDPPLEIVGPPGIEQVVQPAAEFVKSLLGRDALPVRVTALQAGETWSDASYRIETCAMIHPRPGLSLRVTDLARGTVLAFSGDTSYNQAFVELATDADVLIHEATLGVRASGTPVDGGHCGGEEAGKTALEAGVDQLFLTHIPRARRLSALAGARRFFPAAELLEDGDFLETGPRDQGGRLST